MKTNDKKDTKKHELTEAELNEAWLKLWKFANEAIDSGDCSIGYDYFIEDGKKIFDIRIKPKEE